MWEAVDATSWRAHFPWTDRPPRNLPLQGIMQKLSSDPSATTKLPTLAKLAIAPVAELFSTNWQHPSEPDKVKLESERRKVWQRLGYAFPDRSPGQRPLTIPRDSNRGMQSPPQPWWINTFTPE